MHEWALADAVVTTALKVAENEGLKEISEIIVKIGELQTNVHNLHGQDNRELRNFHLLYPR